MLSFHLPPYLKLSHCNSEGERERISARRRGFPLAVLCCNWVLSLRSSPAFSCWDLQKRDQSRFLDGCAALFHRFQDLYITVNSGSPGRNSTLSGLAAVRLPSHRSFKHRLLSLVELEEPKPKVLPFSTPHQSLTIYTTSRSKDPDFGQISPPSCVSIPTQ